jgi:CBS domain-containing protein
MLAKDVMTRNVVSVRPHMPARAAAALLVAQGFASAPVMTAEGVLGGIVTEADLMRGQPLPGPGRSDAAPDTTVGAVMTPEPLTMRPDDDLADVVAVMLDHRLRSVPIVEYGQLAGIISRRDILQCVARRRLVERASRDRDLRPPSAP